MPLHLRDIGAGLISASTGIGAIVAPWIVVPLLHIIGWRLAFVVTAAFGVLWLVAWLLRTHSANHVDRDTATAQRASDR
jgi:ACS family hexuronate transporter-like MFS transporter